MATPTRKMTDDELAALGWDYVARGVNGEAVSVTSKDNTDHPQAILEWLGEGFTVTQLFR